MNVEWDFVSEDTEKQVGVFVFFSFVLLFLSKRTTTRRRNKTQ